MKLSAVLCCCEPRPLALAVPSPRPWPPAASFSPAWDAPVVDTMTRISSSPPRPSAPESVMRQHEPAKPSALTQSIIDWEDALTDPIGGELLVDAVRLQCGHLTNYAAAMEWFQISGNRCADCARVVCANLAAETDIRDCASLFVKSFPHGPQQATQAVQQGFIEAMGERIPSAICHYVKPDAAQAELPPGPSAASTSGDATWQLTHHTDPHVRVRAARLLAARQGDETRARLIEMMFGDDSQWVRAEVNACF